MITQRLKGAVAEFSGLRRGWSCKEITVKQGFGVAQLALVVNGMKLEKEIQHWGSCCHDPPSPLIGYPKRNTFHFLKTFLSISNKKPYTSLRPSNEY